MCICTNSTHQFSKKKVTTKQKQRKLNAKREPTTIHIQPPPQDTPKTSKNAQERQKQYNGNLQQQQEQTNKHTVLPTEIAKMHKKRHSKNTEHNIYLIELGGTRKTLRARL
jgi:hypothetical protein